MIRPRVPASPLTCLALGLCLLLGCGDSSGPETAPGAGDAVSGGGQQEGQTGGGLLKVGGKKQETGNYIILGTLTDQFDRAQSKANVEDTLAKHSDIDAMVGLFAYNPVDILEALRQAGRLGKKQKIQVIAFDEADETLQGIKDGTVKVWDISSLDTSQ